MRGLPAFLGLAVSVYLAVAGTLLCFTPLRAVLVQVLPPDGPVRPAILALIGFLASYDLAIMVVGAILAFLFCVGLVLGQLRPGFEVR